MSRFDKLETTRVHLRVTKIDDVTSRVAENLVKKDIYNMEDLKSLSEEELMEVNGIGPKRAEKILKL